MERIAFKSAAVALPLLLIVLALVGYRLARQGAREFLDSSGGRITEAITDPAAPGFEAIVETTPVQFVMLTDGDGELASAAIMSQALDEAGGALVVFPGAIEIAETSLRDVFGSQGGAATADVVSQQVNVAFENVSVVGEDEWADLLSELGPVPIDIPDRLVRRDAVGTASLVFESGRGSIQPEFMPLYVGWQNPDEKSFVWLSRQFGLWEAFIDAAAANPAAIGGESPFAVMLRSILQGTWDLREVDYTVEPDDRTIVLDEDLLSGVMVELVPFPQPATNGGRARVRLLDGVGNSEAIFAHAATLVGAGAQITVLGNDTEFGLGRTRIVVHDPDARQWADDFGAALGAGTIETDTTRTAAGADTPSSDAPTSDTAEPAGELPETIFDVTVIIGNDVSN